METELANWMAHEYKSAIWQLQHATDPAQSDRVKRNILGDFIGGVTGLVTHEQFTGEHKELKETEGRVEKILNHQINIEKLMEEILEMSHDMVTKAGVIAWLQDLRIRMERNAVYQTKKVTCRRGGTSHPALRCPGWCWVCVSLLKQKGGAALTRRCLDSAETKENLNEKWQSKFIIKNIIIIVLQKFTK